MTKSISCSDAGRLHLVCNCKNSRWIDDPSNNLCQKWT